MEPRCLAGEDEGWLSKGILHMWLRIPFLGWINSYKQHTTLICHLLSNFAPNYTH